MAYGLRHKKKRQRHAGRQAAEPGVQRPHRAETVDAAQQRQRPGPEHVLEQHDEDRQRDQQRVQQPADDTSYAACL